MVAFSCPFELVFKRRAPKQSIYIYFIKLQYKKLFKMSVSDILERIRNRMAAVDPNGSRKCLGVIQINLSDQHWTMDLKNLTLAEGINEAADASFDMDDDTFVQLGNKSLTIGEAESSGKVVIAGDKKLLAALNEVSQE